MLPRSVAVRRTLLLCALLAPCVARPEAIPVELKPAEHGWQLVRGGQPYLIKGADGAASLAARYRAAGASKPFILTAFGPAGLKEIATAEQGAPLEPTSTQKAAIYQSSYQSAVLDSNGWSFIKTEFAITVSGRKTPETV